MQHFPVGIWTQRFCKLRERLDGNYGVVLHRVYGISNVGTNAYTSLGTEVDPVSHRYDIWSRQAASSFRHERTPVMKPYNHTIAHEGTLNSARGCRGSQSHHQLETGTAFSQVRYRLEPPNLTRSVDTKLEQSSRCRWSYLARRSLSQQDHHEGAWAYPLDTSRIANPASAILTTITRRMLMTLTLIALTPAVSAGLLHTQGSSENERPPYRSARLHRHDDAASLRRGVQRWTTPPSPEDRSTQRAQRTVHWRRRPFRSMRTGPTATVRPSASGTCGQGCPEQPTLARGRKSRGCAAWSSWREHGHKLIHRAASSVRNCLAIQMDICAGQGCGSGSGRDARAQKCGEGRRFRFGFPA